MYEHYSFHVYSNYVHVTRLNLLLLLRDKS